MAEPWIDAEWIRDRLQATKKTQRALSAAIGLDPSAVSRLLEGARQLKAHEVPKIIEFFDLAPSLPEEIATSGDGRPRADGSSGARFAGQRDRISPGPKLRPKPALELSILGPLLPDGPNFYSLENGIAERRPSPPQLTGVPGAYGLFVPDNRLAPRYRAGEVIYVHPFRPPTTGSYVVVRFRSPSGRVAIGEVTSADEKFLNLRAVPDDGRIADVRIRTAEIGQIGRIVVTATE